MFRALASMYCNQVNVWLLVDHRSRLRSSRLVNAVICVCARHGVSQAAMTYAAHGKAGSQILAAYSMRRSQEAERTYYLLTTGIPSATHATLMQVFGDFFFRGLFCPTNSVDAYIGSVLIISRYYWYY